MSGVQLSGVTKSFGASNVIPKMDLGFDEGEFVVIVGQPQPFVRQVQRLLGIAPKQPAAVLQLTEAGKNLR